MTTKLTRQFSTDNPAALRRDLFRLCDELGSALAKLSTPAAAASASECVLIATAVAASTSAVAVSFSGDPLVDTDGYFRASAPTRLTAPEDGPYEVIGTLHESTTSTTYELDLRLDGGSLVGAGGNTGTLNDTGAIAMWRGTLSEGQYFELLIDAAGSVTAERITFSMRRCDR